MANDQGRLHRRKRRSKIKKALKAPTQCGRMVFVDRDDGLYVWENHEYGRLPLKEPEECEIVFHDDKLWQDDSDKWSIFLLLNDADDSDEAES